MTSSAIGRSELLYRIATKDIFISPSPGKREVGKGTVDLRLGSVFLTGKRSSVPFVDASDPDPMKRLFNRVRIGSEYGFVLQPGQFVLASTLEYISLPLSVRGQIQSRSSFGRMGLVSAAASLVGPGWKGCPTLELKNIGEVAIVVRPGLAVSQMQFETASETDTRPSRYQFSIYPHYALQEEDGWLKALEPVAETGC